MKKITVALVGQPNVGKSMLINSISNAHLHVGNFSGVTVEKAEVTFEYEGYEILVVDLPGTYALNDYSIEERVTKNFIETAEFDIIVNVADATHLAKNLQLTAELMSKGRKMVLALNMMDEAEKDNIKIDDVQMRKLFAMSVIKVSAAKKIGIDKLLKAIVKTYEKPYSEPKIVFSESVEEEIEVLNTFFDKHTTNSEFQSRGFAIDLLRQDKLAYQKVKDEPIWMELSPVLNHAVKHIELHHTTDDIKEAFSEEYRGFIYGVTSECVNKPQEVKKSSLTDRIDDFLIHPYLGIPLFLFFMWGLFQLTFEIGSIPMDYIDMFFGWLGETVGSTIEHQEIRSLIVDGIIAGVGAVVLFVPNIIILFIGIAMLESTGYMSRVAFLLDGFFHRFGLHGQSFIPLVTGFGCSIPAYMSARILKNDRDRLLTLFIIGFMSCGARLPVYVLFAGAFFSQSIAGNVLFAIYIAGAIIGLVLAKVLKMTAFKGEEEPFVMEMPRYRWPSLKLIWHTVLTKVWMYLKKAGTFIAAASILIWFLSTYPKNDTLMQSYEAKIEQATGSEQTVLNNALSEQLLEQSYLGQLGQVIEPAFAPLGFDWKMSVALLSGLAAKEVVVSTLGVLYALGDEVDEESDALKETLSKSIPFAAAIAYIVVVMTYLPCLAASVVFTREAGGIKYFFYLLGFTSLVAYLLAFITYTVASAF